MIILIIKLLDWSALVLVSSPPASDSNHSDHGRLDYRAPVHAVHDLDIYINSGLTLD